jgi:3,4-dihydroxy 2-butanone 4-phosphate synthase/GTP cyclohydrolase II
MDTVKSTPTQFASVDEAVASLKAGEMIILVDDQERENEGDLVIAAEHATPEMINFMAKHARGLICLSASGRILDKLQIPMMVHENKARWQTAFTVSIEAAEGVTTGISAYDRAHTIKTAIADNATAEDIVMPGHVFPIRAREGGVLFRAGHTEGSVDLVSMAGCKPAAVICEIMNDDGSMARLPELMAFAAQHDIKIASIEDLIAYRRERDNLVYEVASSRMPLQKLGEFELKVFESNVDNLQHVALIRGEIDPSKPVLVRVHSECLTGDVFGSARCDCGWQLQAALERISKDGGILLYMRQEGRGIGIVNKIKAYALQDQGMDTVEANHYLGFEADQRDYGIGSQILQMLGVKQMRLLTNNPRKIYGIGAYDIDVVAREPIEMLPTQDNVSYLTTKRDKLGHILNLEVE